MHWPDGRPTTVNIMDDMRVPAGIAPGEYILGFRWDCELRCGTAARTSPLLPQMLRKKCRLEDARQEKHGNPEADIYSRGYNKYGTTAQCVRARQRWVGGLGNR